MTDARAGRWVLFVILLSTLLAYHPAWQGWFQDDDLDNLSWAATNQTVDYFKTLLSPVFARDTFRPTGHLVYHVVAQFAGESYAWYLAALQLFHLVNICLLWWLLGRLGASVPAAAGGTALFAVHPACFAAGWRPMFYFDVLCATFCLLALACWMRRKWVLALICFVIGYRAKELTVMLPVVLAAWEFLLGERRWKPLVPFFLVSASFGVQALWANRITNDPYTLRPSLAVIWQCLNFYSGHLFFPYSAVLLTGIAVWIRDRRSWFGVVMFWVTLLPMLVLPGRLNPLYLYVPLIGVSILAVVLLDHARFRLPAVLCLGAWLVYCFVRLVPFEARELRIAADNRAFVRTATAALLAHPEIHSYAFEGHPPDFAHWGLSGGLTFVARGRKLSDEPYLADNAREIETGVLAARVPMVLLAWDPEVRRAATLVRTAETKLWPYVPMCPLSPVWQLGKGWYVLESGSRWTAPHAEARLARPDARWFEVVADLPEPSDSGVKERVIRVTIDGQALESRSVRSAGLRSFRWNAPAGNAESCAITIEVDPGYRHPDDVRVLGAQISGFGFKE